MFIAAWLVFVVFFPWVGIFMTIFLVCYFISETDSKRPTVISPKNQEKLNKIYKQTYKSWSK